MDKRILITGTDGFIGKALKTHFLEKGFQVFGTTFFSEPSDGKEIQFDITNKEDLSKLWKNEKFDTIIHTIGLVDQMRSSKDLFAVNALGAKIMCDYAKSKSCNHFIFTSSVSVYGFKTLGENRTECNTKRKFQRFFIAYGRSKARAEKYIEKSGLMYSILRLPIVLGRDDTIISPSIIPRLQNGTIFTSGKKRTQISLLYVKNLGPVLERLIEVGPINQCANCLSDTIFWDDLVKQFAFEMNVEYKPLQKNSLSYLFHSKDKNYQLISAFSARGAHYPGELLAKYLNLREVPYNWKYGVKEAVQGYLGKKKA